MTTRRGFFKTLLGAAVVSVTMRYAPALLEAPKVHEEAFSLLKAHRMIKDHMEELAQQSMLAALRTCDVPASPSAFIGTMC